MPKREDEFWAKKIDDASENNQQTEEEYPDTKIEDKTSPKSKAWFGTEFYDKKTRKWKKPEYKKSTVTASIIALLVVIIIVIIVILYGFVFTKPVS